MAAGKTQLLNRFPGLRKLIDDLFDSNRNFNDLCREYGEVTQQIDRLSDMEDPGVHQQALGLRRRRDHLETELRAMMEQNTRV